MNNKNLGNKGEDLITKYCQNIKGFKILHTNYKCQKFGELDIVAQKENTLIFVEVKSRKTNAFMEIYEQLDNRKIKALIRAIKYYILKNKVTNKTYRLDLATYNDTTKEIKYYENIYNE